MYLFYFIYVLYRTIIQDINDVNRQNMNTSNIMDDNIMDDNDIMDEQLYQRPQPPTVISQSASLTNNDQRAQLKSGSLSRIQMETMRSKHEHRGNVKERKKKRHQKRNQQIFNQQRPQQQRNPNKNYLRPPLNQPLIDEYYASSQKSRSRSRSLSPESRFNISREASSSHTNVSLTRQPTPKKGNWSSHTNTPNLVIPTPNVQQLCEIKSFRDKNVNDQYIWDNVTQNDLWYAFKDNTGVTQEYYVDNWDWNKYSGLNTQDAFEMEKWPGIIWSS